MAEIAITAGTVETARHRTAYLTAGCEDGPLMIFSHGWPELGRVWHNQILHFAAQGWRCVAPDMRGYGGSSVPTRISDYSVRETTADLCELQDALGGTPAIWVGHDLGSAPVWMMAAHYPERCRGIVSLCVPYFSRGNTLANMSSMVDRSLYPADDFPVGQWDYRLYHEEHPGAASASLEADVNATISALYRRASPDVVAQPSAFSNVRERGGFFGTEGRAPLMPPDDSVLTGEDHAALVTAFSATGFRGANAWYLNDADYERFAAESPNFGKLTLPVLFVHAAYDTVCDTCRSALAEPMREDCASLTEATINAGHWLMLEEPDALNAVMDQWLKKISIG